MNGSVTKDLILNCVRLTYVEFLEINIDPYSLRFFILLLQFNFDDGPEIKAPHRLGVYVKDPNATIPIATEFKLDFELEQSYG